MKYPTTLKVTQYTIIHTSPFPPFASGGPPEQAKVVGPNPIKAFKGIWGFQQVIRMILPKSTAVCFIRLVLRGEGTKYNTINNNSLCMQLRKDRLVRRGRL